MRKVLVVRHLPRLKQHPSNGAGNGDQPDKRMEYDIQVGVDPVCQMGRERCGGEAGSKNAANMGIVPVVIVFYSLRFEAEDLSLICPESA